MSQRRFLRPGSPVAGNRSMFPLRSSTGTLTDPNHDPYYLPSRLGREVRTSPRSNLDRFPDTPLPPPRTYEVGPPTSYGGGYTRPRRATLDHQARRPVVVPSSRPFVYGGNLAETNRALVHTGIDSDPDDDYYLTSTSPAGRRQVRLDDETRDGRISYHHSSGPARRKTYHDAGPELRSMNGHGSRYAADDNRPSRRTLPTRERAYHDMARPHRRADSLDTDRRERPLSMSEIGHHLPRDVATRGSGPPPPSSSRRGLDRRFGPAPVVTSPTSYEPAQSLNVGDRDSINGRRAGRHPPVVQVHQEPRARHHHQGDSDGAYEDEDRDDDRGQPHRHRHDRGMSSMTADPRLRHLSHRARHPTSDDPSEIPNIDDDDDDDEDGRWRSARTQIHHRSGHRHEQRRDGSSSSSSAAAEARRPQDRSDHHSSARVRPRPPEDVRPRASVAPESRSAEDERREHRARPASDARDPAGSAIHRRKRDPRDVGHDLPEDSRRAPPHQDSSPLAGRNPPSHNLAVGRAARDDDVAFDDDDRDNRDHRRGWISGDGSTMATTTPNLHVRVMSPPRNKETKAPLKGILREPRPKFPEDPTPLREGVAPLKDARKDGRKGVPPDARWTKIDRRRVNPAALEEARERFEERPDHVIVLRVLTRDEIEALALRTLKIRGLFSDPYHLHRTISDLAERVTVVVFFFSPFLPRR